MWMWMLIWGSEWMWTVSEMWIVSEMWMWIVGLSVGCGRGHGIGIMSGMWRSK